MGSRKMLSSWLWLCWCCVAIAIASSTARAESTAGSAASPSPSTATQYLRMTWTDTDIVRVTFAEPFLASAIATFLDASDVSVVDTREPPALFSMELEAATRSTFQMLFRISTDMNTTALNSTALDADGLGSYLQSALPTAVHQATSTTGDPAASTVSPLSLSFEILSDADTQALGPFPALAIVGQPPSPSTFMTLDVFFRNMPSPANLTQGMIYQTRQGVTRFLRLPSIGDIYAAGPAQVPANAALQVVQRFYLVVPSELTMEAREKLANLLLYGDPEREIDDFANNDGFFATARASMFFDYILPAQTQIQAQGSGDASGSATELEVSMMEALFSYAFSSLSIDQFPSGNPPAPAPAQDSATGFTAIPAVSTEVLASKMRKRHRFLYDAAGFGSSELFPANVAYPSNDASPAANSSCTMASGFCTYIYWKNSLESTTFWLESFESVHRVAWNLFPSTSFFASPDDQIQPTTLAPIISPGNTSTPIWSFGALSGPASRLDFALNLRNVDDNATALKVEIATDVRSSVEATSTITSIARDTSAAVKLAQTPVFETKSNVVVTYQSRFRNSNELFLYLEIKASSVTKKDTSQPCAHCQNLYEWCASQPKCAALASCVFAQGIDRDAIPHELLFSSPVQSARELWPYFQSCLSPTTGDAVDLKAMLLLSNAVRCQMQRMCTFRTPAYYGITEGDSDEKILIWESGEARQQLRTQLMNSHFSKETPVNVSMRLGSQVLCYLPIFANATAEYLEETITRTCKLAKYLGRVSVSVSMTGGDASIAAADSYDSIEIRYKYLVGPLPTLEVVPAAAAALASAANATAVKIQVVAFPGIRLRLETLGFQNILPPAPTNVATPDVCAACNKLALSGCLRDLKCVAFTDCIMRYTPPLDSPDPTVAATSAQPLPLGDVILDTFRNESVGEQFSLSSAIDACHSSRDVSDLAWRKLVNASACFSKQACPISMAMLVPSSADRVVGKWRINPAQKVQKLLYQQQDQQELGEQELRIPLELIRDGEIAKSDSSSVDELERKLQALLEFDDVAVEIEFDRPDSTSGLRSVQWSIAYSHWIGALPRFLPETSVAPQWALFTYPSPQQDVYLEVLNGTYLAANNGTLADSTNVTTIPV